ncbi:MAG: carboxypeptidase-like regulatory domain-containing protein [bacterium]
MTHPLRPACLLLGFLLGSAVAAQAKCASQRIVLEGAVRDAPAGKRQVLITARFPKESDLNLLVDVEDGAFSATVPFSTYKGRGLFSADNCSRKPKSVRLALFLDNREAGSIQLDFPRDFVEGPGAYRPRQAPVLCCSERVAGRLVLEMPLPDEIVVAIAETEIPELERRGMETLCLRVNGRDPSPELSERLRQLYLRIKLKEGGWCFKKQRGFDLRVDALTLSSEEATVVVEAVDPRLGDAHFTTLLWTNRYSFGCAAGRWTRASREQLCCNEPAAPVSLADSPTPMAMTLSVLVVDPGWLPVPGVKVSARRVSACNTQAPSSKPMTVTTGEKGWADFPVEGPASYLVSIKGEGGFRSTEKCVKLYAVPTRSYAYVQMQLHTEVEVPLHDPN